MSNSQGPVHSVEALLNSIPAQVAILDGGGVVRFANAAWAGARVGDGYLASAEPEIAAGVREVLSGRRPSFTVDGPTPGIRLVAAPIRGGTETGAVVILFPTQPVPAETAAVAASRPGIFMADQHGNQTFSNARFREICGGNHSWNSLVHPEDRTAVQAGWAEAVRDRREFSGQFRFVAPNGEIRVAQLEASALVSPEGACTGYAGTFEDITERRRDEEQALQAQKMEAVGRLAGGVAHDFANLLTMISGYSEILLNRMHAADPLRPELEEIRRAANRGSGLTTQLLAYSRRQEVEPQILDVNAVVNETEGMLRRMIGEHIELRTILDANVGNVRAASGQMQQVIMNLVLNARDAMPKGGRITIETANVDLNADTSRQYSGIAAGAYVVLAFTDTGSGMDAETMSHLYEPFFTTKERGKGTGLGLSTVYGIVKQCGGDVWARSEVGCGTTFTILLPRAAEIAPAPRSAPQPRAAESGSETILLVEDEAGVRKLLKYILTKRGYTVLEAADAFDAEEICLQYSGAIHLLLTDIIMPRRNGRELAKRALEIRPDLKVVYMSGYTDDMLLRTGALRPGMSFLQKPLKPEVLTSRIREVLDGPAHAGASAAVQSIA